MVEKIVVAVDGSAPSESALLWAMERARRTRAKVTVITVVEDTVAYLVPGLSERLAASARSFLDDVRERAGKLAPGVDVTGEVAHGSVLSALASITRDADLLVIGTQRHGVVLGAMRGTLSVRIAATVSCSIAVVPETPPTGIHVVVGVDGSEQALFACEAAAAEAVASDSVLLIICAGYVTNPLLTSLVPTDIASLDHAKALTQAEAYVLERFPDAHVRTKSIYGSPADALRDESRSARLLVIGHRTRSALQRLMRASVGNEVFLDISVPVLLARRPAGAAAVPDSTRRSTPLREQHTGGRTIVGWSGSAASERALAWAAAHRIPQTGDLVVARVVDDATLLPYGSDPDRVVAVARRELDDRVDQIRRENPGSVVDALLLRGDPYSELRRTSDSSTLVVIGTQHRSRSSFRSAWSLGVRLAGNGGGPIAIIPDGDWTSHNVVVVGVDGSAAAATAVRFAAKDAAARGSELRIVHAWQEPMAWQDLYAAADEGFVHSVAEAHEHVLEEAAADVRAAFPELRLRRDLVRGEPAKALLEAAHGTRLLVVGNHGRHPAMRFLLGSVSHTVALNIESPIVVVPAVTDEQAYPDMPLS